MSTDSTARLKAQFQNRLNKSKPQDETTDSKEDQLKSKFLEKKETSKKESSFQEEETVVAEVPTKNAPVNKSHLLIDVTKIEANPFQPRKKFTNINELATSIKNNGLMQPIVVAKINDNYVLVAGERRMRAFRELHKKHGEAYLKIPALLETDSSDENLQELALIENVHREDMTVVEYADAYGQLSEKGLSLSKIATLTGKGKTSVNRFIVIYKLPETVKDVFRNHKTASTNKMELLAQLTDEDLQIEFANEIIKEVSFDTLKRKIELLLNSEEKGSPKKPIISLSLDKLKSPKELFPKKLYKSLDDENKAKVDDLVLNIEKMQSKLTDFREELEK